VSILKVFFPVRLIAILWNVLYKTSGITITGGGKSISNELEGICSCAEDLEFTAVRPFFNNNLLEIDVNL
jgi:hypothetical protein